MFVAINDLRPMIDIELMRRYPCSKGNGGSGSYGINLAPTVTTPQDGTASSNEKSLLANSNGQLISTSDPSKSDNLLVGRIACATSLPFRFDSKSSVLEMGLWKISTVRVEPSRISAPLQRIEKPKEFQKIAPSTAFLTVVTLFSPILRALLENSSLTCSASSGILSRPASKYKTATISDHSNPAFVISSDNATLRTYNDRSSTSEVLLSPKNPVIDISRLLRSSWFEPARSASSSSKSFEYSADLLSSSIS